MSIAVGGDIDLRRCNVFDRPIAQINAERRSRRAFGQLVPIRPYKRENRWVASTSGRTRVSHRFNVPGISAVSFRSRLRTNAVCMATQAPCPRLGDIAWAASPITATLPFDQALQVTSLNEAQRPLSVTRSMYPRRLGNDLIHAS